MRKPLLIAIPIIVLIIAAGAYLLANNQTDQTQQETANVVTTDNPATEETVSADTQAASPSPGAYVDYQDDIISSTAGTKLLFFHAPWCPQCRALEADIKKNGVPDGVTIIKVDYDSNQALRQKYGVTIQTTVVLLDDRGNLVKKYVAYDEPTLQSVKDNLL